MTVAIGVEEHSVDIFLQTVGLKGGLRALAKAAVPLLNEESSSLPLRSAHVEIIEAVAIHVADGQRWTFRGKQMGDQRLASIIEIVILDVPETDLGPRRDIREQRLSRAPSIESRRCPGRTGAPRTPLCVSRR